MPMPSPSKESELPKESPLLARKTRRRDIRRATTPLPNSTRASKLTARPRALPSSLCWAHRVACARRSAQQPTTRAPRARSRPCAAGGGQVWGVHSRISAPAVGLDEGVALGGVQEGLGLDELCAPAQCTQRHHTQRAHALLPPSACTHSSALTLQTAQHASPQTRSAPAVSTRARRCEARSRSEREPPAAAARGRHGRGRRTARTDTHWESGTHKRELPGRERPPRNTAPPHDDHHEDANVFSGSMARAHKRASE